MDATNTEHDRIESYPFPSDGTGLDLNAIAAHFKGKGRWRERLPMILETLVAIGRVRVGDPDRFSVII